jgi:hypothetical protein
MSTHLFSRASTAAVAVLAAAVLLLAPATGHAVSEDDLIISLHDTAWQWSDGPWTWTLSIVPTDDPDDPRFDLKWEKSIIYTESGVVKYELDGFSKRKLRFEIEERDGKQEQTIYFDIEGETCVPYKIKYTDQDGDTKEYELTKLR